MRYLVGYTADRGGRLALHLASQLALDAARASDGTDRIDLDLVIVVPRQSPYADAAPGADPLGYEEILDSTARGWAQDALAMVPEGVSARVLIRAADSEAEGILAAAQEVDAGAIVIATRKRAVPASLGSVANALLHSSPIPVLLASPGRVPEAPAPFKPTRITAFIGTRKGSEAVALTAAIVAQRQHLPLRIVSLLDLDSAQGSSPEAIARTQESIEEIAGRAALGAEVVVARGKGLDAALKSVPWQEQEIAIIGSSRLGGNRLFLGVAAHKVVKDLPVPVMVIPRHLDPRTLTPAGGRA